MTATTLYTFTIYNPYAYSVQLIGSWDNFAAPYQLEKDRQGGHGCWKGCYSFDNIICDGDTRGPFKKRCGGLKQGGTYWYQYLINGDEVINPSESFTTTCPLFPGQLLNELEIPIELDPAYTTDSAYDALKGFTLDPKDRYKKLRVSSRPRLPIAIGPFDSRNNTPARFGEGRLRKMFSGSRNSSTDTVAQPRGVGSTPRILPGGPTSIPSQPAHNLEDNSGTATPQLSAPPMRNGSITRPKTPKRNKPAVTATDSNQVEIPGDFGLASPRNALHCLGQLETSPLDSLSISKSLSAVSIPGHDLNTSCVNISQPRFTINPLGGNPCNASLSLTKHGQSSSYSFIEREIDPNSPTFETPPQLSSSLSINTSPESFILHTPPRLRNQARDLPHMKQHETISIDINAHVDSQIWGERPARYADVFESNITKLDLPRLGSPFTIHTGSIQTLEPQQAKVDFENPFLSVETQSLAAQQLFPTYFRTSRDSMLQDLTYLGSAIT